MNIPESILSALSAILAGGNIAQLIAWRSIKKKHKIDADSAHDNVLYDRIRFLDERLSRLENRACFNENCKERI